MRLPARTGDRPSVVARWSVTTRYRGATRPRCEDTVTARSPRLARTAGSFLLSAALLTLTACASRTVAIEDGEEPAEDLSLGVNLLLYVGIPVLIFVLTAIPIFLSASRRKSRYRPNEGWDNQPVWFAGPDDPERAVDEASPDQPGRGGASGGW